jgi:hypothetical protein
MKEQFVDYTIALELKELGFDEECLGIYISNVLNPYLMYASQHDVDMATGNDGILAPLYQQVFDWFREVCKLDVMVYKSLEGQYYFWITSVGNNFENNAILYDRKTISYYDNYYDARKESILKAIELCKKNFVIIL